MRDNCGRDGLSLQNLSDSTFVACEATESVSRCFEENVDIIFLTIGFSIVSETTPIIGSIPKVSSLSTLFL